MAKPRSKFLFNPFNKIRFPDFNNRPVFKFISKRSGPFKGAVTLTRDRVYIIPTKAGLIFALLLFTLLIGSINYEKNLGFILTFLLAGIGNIALLSTWRNIAGLELNNIQNSGSTAPVFAGEMATFNVQLINKQNFHRRSLAISQQGVEQDVIDCPANSKQLIRLTVQSRKRGLLNAGKFRLYTEFPTGLFVAWTWADLSMSCLVYPSPDKKTEQAAHHNSESGEHDFSGNGLENFSQLRKYHHGDNINHISWKAAAKTGELFTKEFIGSTPQTQWINWNDITARDNEHRLSIMCALIIHAEKNRLNYGVKLPGKEITPASGNKHYHQCLTALALF